MADSKIAKLEVKRDICIGATPCIVAAPAAMELDGESKAVYKVKGGAKSSGPINRDQIEDPSVDDATLLIAAQSCPVKAIFLWDENGKQIYPE